MSARFKMKFFVNANHVHWRIYVLPHNQQTWARSGEGVLSKHEWADFRLELHESLIEFVNLDEAEGHEHRP